VSAQAYSTAAMPVKVDTTDSEDVDDHDHHGSQRPQPVGVCSPPDAEPAAQSNMRGPSTQSV
jgi:hypothetical protein